MLLLFLLFLFLYIPKYLDTINIFDNNCVLKNVFIVFFPSLFVQLQSVLLMKKETFGQTLHPWKQLLSKTLKHAKTNVSARLIAKQLPFIMLTNCVSSIVKLKLVVKLLIRLIRG